MEIIGIICEYNPFHNGHLLHIKKIKEMYPESYLILVLNGYFLERGEISYLTKESKTKIALDNGVDIVLELPILFGSQASDIFAETALTILNNLKVSKVVFGSECNDIKLLENIVDHILKDDYQKKVKKLLKLGINYPTALAKAISQNLDFNKPNDLLAISYIKAIKKNNFNITPISIKRTSNYHDTNSNDEIISASNIRNRLKNNEDISKYIPKNVKSEIIYPKYEILFKLIKNKILTTPHLEQFLTVDEGIESRLIKAAQISHTLEELIAKIKTKRYTYNKINRMLIHILLGITKEDNKIAKLDYIKILGFNENGQKYLQSIKKGLNIPVLINKDSILYKYELKAAIIYDLIQNTNTYEFELKNSPIKKTQ